MKLLRILCKKIVLGIFGIYSINVIFSSINVIIPMNLFSIAI